jgi:hypothetical protein
MRKRRTIVTSERLGRRFREPAGRFRPCHQSRAGLGVWCATRSRADRAAIRAWKLAHLFDETMLAGFSAGLAGLIRAWSPVLPAGTVVTVPPQGASAPGPYAAEVLGRRVAEDLGLPFAQTLGRDEPKRWHGPQHSLRQGSFRWELPAGVDARMIVVIDDLVTSGATMRRSLEAIRAAGFMAFGFAFSGC